MKTSKFEINKIYNEDCVSTMKRMTDDFVDLVVTSPPYFGCRQYGDETLGRESDPRDYIKNIVEISSHVKRILNPNGSFYLNIGDVYFGSKGFSRNKGRWERKTDHHYKEHKICKSDGKYIQHKQLLLLPTRIAAAMQDEGWVLRNDIIWEKANPLPASARDRRLPCYEHIFHFVKSRKYFFDEKKAKELGSHRDFFRSSVKPFKDHPAAFTESIIEPLILTSSTKKQLVYDPFMGSGTTAVVAKKYGRKYVGSEINPDYIIICERNIQDGIVPINETEDALMEINDDSILDEDTHSTSDVAACDINIAQMQQKLGWIYEEKSE